MRRSFVIAVGTVSALGLLGLVTAAPAYSRGIPPAGTVRCGLTGSATFSPALPSASNPDGSAKPIKFKLKADIGPCDNGSVTGPHVTDGTLAFKSTLDEGSGCQDLIDFGAPDVTSNTNRLQIKWTATAPSGKRSTVGKSKTDMFDAEQINKVWELTSDSFGDADAFGGESATIDLILDNLGQVGACAFGGPDLASVTFSAAGGANIVVAP